MKRLMIPAITVIAALAAVSSVRWLHPASSALFVNAGMPSLQELHTSAGINKLKESNFDDRSVIFTTADQR